MIIVGYFDIKWEKLLLGANEHKQKLIFLRRIKNYTEGVK